MYSDKYASLASLLHRLAGSDGSGFVSHSPVWDRGNVWPWSWSRAPLRSVDWTDLTQNYLLVLFLDWSPPSLLKLWHYKLSFLRIRELWYDELGSFFVIFIFFYILLSGISLRKTNGKNQLKDSRQIKIKQKWLFSNFYWEIISFLHQPRLLIEI